MAVGLVTAYYRFYFYIKSYLTTADHTVAWLLDVNGNAKCYLGFNRSGAGTLEFFDQTPSLLATGTTVLNMNTWYRIEMAVGTGSPAAWEVRLAVGDGTSSHEMGSTDAGVSGANLGTFNNGYLQFGSVQRLDTDDFLYDDVAVDSGGFPGPGSVRVLHPRVQGTYSGWTITAAGPQSNLSNLYQSIFETVPDGDVSFVATTSPGNLITTKFGTVGSLIVSAVKQVAVVKNNSGAFNLVSLVFLSSPANPVFATAVDPGGGYATLASVFNKDPATSVFWTTAGVNALEAGLGSTSPSSLAVPPVLPVFEVFGNGKNVQVGPGGQVLV